MADDETRDKEAADNLDPAYDSIDATMKNVPPKEVTVTPEALAQIVNDAVAKAITEYQQTQGLTPEPAAPPPERRVLRERRKPSDPWRAKMEKLKGDMGLDEIEFEEPPPEPVEAVVQRELSTQMGVNDFEFEDAPGVAAEPNAPTRTEADAMAGWATRPDAIAGWVTPVQNAAPPETPVIDQTPAPAAAEEKTADEEPQLDWIAAELARLAEEPTTAPPQVEPAPVQASEPIQAREPIQAPEPVHAPEPVTPVQTVAPAIEQPPAAPKPEVRKPEPEVRETKPEPEPEVRETKPEPEVRETLGSLANWFRSALGDRSQNREPAAPVPVQEAEAAAMPTAPTMPAAPPPEPPVVAPAPVVARTEEPPRPARDAAAVSQSMTPDEAAKTIHFTFDPIPPVPPRLPREPEEPPKKIKKSGTFL
jgi:hypothetical protein